MSPGIGFAIGAMLAYGAGDFIYKRAAAAGVPAHHLQMVQGWFFAPTVIAWSVVTRSLFIDAAALWGAMAGLFVFTGFYNFARSLKEGSVSVNAPIFRLSFALTAALAVWLLDEPLTPWKVAGLVFALLAVWLLGAGATGEGGARRTSARSLVRVLVATAAVGVANLLYKVGLRAGATPATLVAVQAMVFVPLSSGFTAVMDRGIRPVRATWRYSGIAALALVLAFELLTEGLARGEASVLVPVAQMGFVVTALAGFFLLGERFTARKGAGLAAALAALVSFALG